MDYLLRFIQDLFALPSFSTWVAFSALGISFLSYRWTRKAVETSQLAFAHAQSESSKLDQLRLEEKRLELLKELILERSKLETMRIDLGVVKARFDEDPPYVKSLLKEFAPIFDQLPQIEEMLRQLERNHESLKSFDPKNGFIELLQRMSDHNKVSCEIGLFIKCVRDSLPEFQAKHDLALKTYRDSITRNDDA